MAKQSVCLADFGEMASSEVWRLLFVGLGEIAGALSADAITGDDDPGQDERQGVVC